VDEKQRIGAAAAALIQAGQTILLDSGTTVDAVIKNVREARVTVVTNALNIASEALKHPEMDVLIAGGMVRKGLNYMVGPQTNQFLQTIRADILFLAVEGVDLRAGFTVPDVYNADNKRGMVASAQKVVVLADHSKLGRVSTCSIIPLHQAHLLITGSEANATLIAELRRYIEVLQV
jgi:DeoR/GlpR family transcriptional regulator of sugar metabolism